MPRTLLTTLCILALAAPALAQPVDLDLVNRIRHEGFENSRVMETVSYITDVIGARVTGSPAMTRANAWTRDELASMGLENAHLHAYTFGRGWDWQSCRVDLLGEAARSLAAIPQGWTPGTDGPVRGELVRLDATEVVDLEKYEGQLAGKIVLISPEKPVEPRDTPPFTRLTDEELADLQDFEIPGEQSGPDWREQRNKAAEFRQALDGFLFEEGAVAIIECSSRDHGIIRALRGAQPDDPETMRMPAVTMMTEQYNRLVRLAEAGETVELEIEIAARFHGDRDSEAFNTLAEIPGRGRGNEVVMLGAHLDSYQSGTGATDDGSSCAVLMEAVRILQAIGFEPRRTIRIALWSGEEQGLLGSQAWVRDNLATRPAPPDSLTAGRSRAFWPREEGPLTLRDEYERVSAYFNLDNGGGRIRGLYAQQNVAVVPIFEEWLAPFADLQATTVTTNRTGGTDHLSFDRVGVPGFQFIQDEMDYFAQTHHTNLDTRDHLQESDLKQAAVIVASVLAHAANREDRIPRKPVDAE